MIKGSGVRNLKTTFAPLKITKMQSIRNIAIIAHVDHGKTTLVDKIIAAPDALAQESISYSVTFLKFSKRQ